MIKAVLFDMDGVLYDSMYFHVRAWHETMTAHGIASTEEDFYLWEGRTGYSTINLLFNRSLGRDATQEEMESIYEQKSKRFAELEYPEAPSMPGALEVLTKVKAKGLKRVIVTGSGQFSLFDKLDKHFPGFFERDLMVTAYDVKFGKPHPEPYLMGLQKAKLTAPEAIVVENAPLGIQAARAAGIFTVGVNTGPLSDRVLLDAGADVIFPSMQALAEGFESLMDELLV